MYRKFGFLEPKVVSERIKSGIRAKFEECQLPVSSGF
jgi:hypothetical protein